MAEANPTPTATAAAAPALTAEQIQAIVTKSVADALAQQATQQATQQAAQQTAAQQQVASQANVANTAAAKPLTAEDVAKLLDQRDASRRSQADREKYQADKLKDLPGAYRNQLGNDAAKWAAEEQAIRSQFQADFKANGGTVANVSGNTSTGAAPVAGAVDLRKLNPVQKIQMGLKGQSMQPGTVNQAAQAILNPSPTATAAQ